MIQTIARRAALTFVLAACGFAWAAPKAPADAAAQGGDVVLYVAPAGDDARSAQSPAEAVRTLGRIQDLLKARGFKEAERRIVVRFLPGTYRGLEVTWDFVAPGRSITFEPDDYQSGRFTVVMDGQNSDARRFFLLRLTESPPDDAPIATAITIRGLHITNYCEGISFGDWKSKAVVSGNLVEGNRLTRIGSMFQSPTRQADGRMMPTGDCVAAIRLQRAANNVIRGNVFEEIENLPAKQTASAKYGPLLLHAIYLANRSSGNLIEGNRFDRFSESPVRIRAESNDTRVVNNTFADPVFPARLKAGYQIKAISQWYCNEAVPACRDKADDGNTECPSLGTQIIGNRVVGPLDLYADESQSKNATCAAGQLRGTGSIEPRLEGNAVSGR